jgi:sucrose-phosphate synthase
LAESDGLYIALVSLHGLIRGTEMELGRDADTGGQVKYVVEVARALAEHPDVWRVDLLTRLIEDPKVSKDYAQPMFH